MALTNGQLAELLAIKSEDAEGFVRKALRRASRLAFVWPVEANDLYAEGESLKSLPGIGPYLEKLIADWFENAPDPAPPSHLRSGFLTLTEAKRIIDQHPGDSSLICSDLQMHSTMSDGASTVEELAEAAASIGHRFIAITDHSKTLKIAGGVDEEEFQRQGSLIDRLNKSAPVLILKSIEMNLSIEGTGDMPPSFLRNLDLVLGSFHSKLRLTQDQTPRYLAAIRNPDVDILGHPRGRIYNFRPGLPADWEKVFMAAADENKAIEVDCFPDRQDIDRNLLITARDAGCLISIGTDSHYAGQLRHIDLGKAAVLETGIPIDRVINTWEPARLIEWAKSHRA